MKKSLSDVANRDLDQAYEYIRDLLVRIADNKDGVTQVCVASNSNAHKALTVALAALRDVGGPILPKRKVYSDSERRAFADGFKRGKTFGVSATWNRAYASIYLWRTVARELRAVLYARDTRQATVYGVDGAVIHGWDTSWDGECMGSEDESRSRAPVRFLKDRTTR